MINYDLNKEFTELNSLLFSNKITPVTVKWVYAKRFCGRVYLDKRGIGISSFYEKTDEQYRNVLAHEMIHMLLMQQNLFDGHDLNFKLHMKRINDMNIGIKISVSGSKEPNYIQRGSPTLRVPMYVMLHEYTNNINLISVLKNCNLKDFKKYANKVKRQKVLNSKKDLKSIKLIECKNAFIKPFTFNIDLSKKLVMSYANDEIVSKLMMERVLYG